MTVSIVPIVDDKPLSTLLGCTARYRHLPESVESQAI